MGGEGEEDDASAAQGLPGSAPRVSEGMALGQSTGSREGQPAKMVPCRRQGTGDCQQALVGFAGSGAGKGAEAAGADYVIAPASCGAQSAGSSRPHAPPRCSPSSSATGSGTAWTA